MAFRSKGFETIGFREFEKLGESCTLDQSVGFSESSARTEAYDQIGKNVIFQAMPPVVIFDDFRVDEWVSAKLKVTNISTTSQRMNILPPESAFFRMRVDKKVL